MAYRRVPPNQHFEAVALAVNKGKTITVTMASYKEAVMLRFRFHQWRNCFSETVTGRIAWATIVSVEGNKAIFKPRKQTEEALAKALEEQGIVVGQGPAELPAGPTGSHTQLLTNIGMLGGEEPKIKD